MAVLTFKGGIHPDDGKRLSKDRPTVKLEPTGDLIYPLSQHIGAPATPVVNVGDSVLVGQKIAESGGFVSANIHSSVSGTVKAIEPRLTIGGSRINSIIIENDGTYKEIQASNLKPLEELTGEEIRNLVKKAGIVGMGGAGFPTHVKLTPKDDHAIDYIIVNAAECEPYLTADYRRMLEQPEKLIDGLKVCLSLFPNAKGLIAIEDNKPDAIVQLRNLVKSEKNIEVKPVYTKYPQGAERHLICALTKRYINSKMLPADAGCIVDNVETVIATGRAVLEGKPVTSRVITVTGDAIKEPGNFEVCLGTNVRELIDAAGGYVSEPEKVIAGGPMMGVALFDIDVPAVKTTSGILCMLHDEASKDETSNCINCGRCYSICPGRIIPTRVAEYAAHGDVKMFEKYNGMECCECGCCSYICPAKRNLTQAIKTMRKEILASRKK